MKNSPISTGRYQLALVTPLRDPSKDDAKWGTRRVVKFPLTLK